MDLARTPHPDGGKVLVMGTRGLGLAGSPGSDATVRLRTDHELPLASTAALAAEAVQALMRRTGHVPPQGPVVTLGSVRTALQSIAPREHEEPVDAQTLHLTGASIQQDMTQWERQQISPSTSEEQLMKDFVRCDYTVDGVALSTPGARSNADALRKILRGQPLDVQRFIHGAAHQGSLADAYGALVRSLHEDAAVLSSAGVPPAEQVSTHFHIALADPERPSVSIKHTRRISRASAMVGADGGLLDLDSAPATTADSGCLLSLTLTLDRTRGQIEATGTQHLRILYPTDRALHLERILTASQQDAPAGDHMLDGLRDYARALHAALPVERALPRTQTATAEAIHEFHRRAVTELAGYRGERVHVIAKRLAHHMHALDGLLVDGRSALQQLQTDHPLTPEQLARAADALADASLHHCAADLQRSALAIANSAAIDSPPEVLPPPAAAALADAHPVIQSWLRAAGVPLHPSDVPFATQVPRPGLARQVSQADDPAARDAALSRLSIAAADLIVTMTDDGLAGVAAALLAAPPGMPSAVPGRTLAETLIDDAQQLQKHGVQTVLPPDLQRFTFDMLARHVKACSDLAPIRTVLDALLRTHIPSPASTSRQAYLACCHLLAAAVHDAGGGTPRLRPHRDQDVLLRRVAAWVNSGIRTHGPLPEMSALVPRRTFLGSWSIAHVRMPPPLQHQTGDGSASVETVVEHLRAQRSCINQILHVTRPTTGTPLPAPAADTVPLPSTVESTASTTASTDRTGTDAAVPAVLTRKLGALLSPRTKIPTLIRLADIAATLKVATALPDEQMVMLLLQPAVTSALVSLAATEALTPCAGSNGRDAKEFCTLVAAALTCALEASGAFGSHEMTRFIQEAFTGDGRNWDGDDASTRGSRSALARLLDARATEAAQELSALLYVRLPALLERRRAPLALMSLTVRTRQGTMTLGKALQKLPTIGGHEQPSRPGPATHPGTTTQRVADLANAISNRLPGQLRDAIAERTRMQQADARLQTQREQMLVKQAAMQAEETRHRHRFSEMVAAAVDRRRARNAMDAEWRAARHREELDSRMHRHGAKRAHADALGRAYQLISYHAATLAQQLQKQEEQDERARMSSAWRSCVTPECVLRVALTRTASSESLASTSTLASHAGQATPSVNGSGSGSPGSTSSRRGADALSSEAALTNWIAAHDIPDDLPADLPSDASPHTVMSAPVRRPDAPRVPLRSDVPATKGPERQAPITKRIHADLPRITGSMMTPEDDAATTAALQAEIRDVASRAAAQRKADTQRAALISREASTQQRIDARRGAQWIPAERHVQFDALSAGLAPTSNAGYVHLTEQEVVAAVAPLGVPAELHEPRLAAFMRGADTLQAWHHTVRRPDVHLLPALTTLPRPPLSPPSPPGRGSDGAPTDTPTDDALAARLARLRADAPPAAPR